MWQYTASIFHIHGGNCLFPPNVSTLLPDYTASNPRRQEASYSPSWEHQVSHWSHRPHRRWKLASLPKRQYLSARLHGVTFQTAVISVFFVWEHHMSHRLHLQHWTRGLYNYRNVGTHAADYAVSQPTRTQHEYSSRWQLHIFWNDGHCQLHPVHT
jgi:hypothetical protein